MQDQLQSLSKKVKETQKAHRNFFIKLRKKTPKNLDAIMEKLHDDEFKKSDCLQCANCCKTTSPIFTNKDIERISKSFRIKTRQFIDNYLNVDEDQDYVLKSSPCTFLADDNTCTIYDVRPKACKEYPHTNRKRFEKISELNNPSRRQKSTTLSTKFSEIHAKLSDNSKR